MSNRHMPPHDPISAELLGRYLAGTATPDERAQVEQWRGATPLRAEVLGALSTRPLESRASAAESVHASAEDIEQRWQRIRGRISPAATPPEQWTRRHPATRLGEQTPGRASGRHVVPSAASSRAVRRYVTALVVPAILVLAGVIAYVMPRAATSPVQGRTYATHVGQQARVTLADGSRIVLAPQSTLTVAEDFNTNVRSVLLDGEAYFQVRSGLHAPFIVRTGDVSTRVLGTEFDVRRYATDAVARVAVMSGKVASGGRQASVTLTAGTVGLITDSTATSLVTDHAGQYGDWQSGRLVFDNEPVSDVLAALGRWYGYAFRLADSSSASQRITAEFNVRSREKTLKAIAVLLNVTMQFDGTTVTLRPRTGHVADTISSHRGRQYPFSRVSEVGK